MDGFVSLFQTLLIDAGCPRESVCTKQQLELPGWFRAEKKWDLVVVHAGQLVAAVEFKSQVGPSFGNSCNNRTEEALGSATDLWAAYREGAFAPSARPWLGYLFLLEDCEASSRPVKVSEPYFKVFPEFQNASYRARYSALITKLVRDRLYDGACFLLSDSRRAESGDYAEPNSELSFLRFVEPLLARVHVIAQRN